MNYHLDLNECVMIGSSLVAFGLFWLVHRSFSRIVTIAIWLFTVAYVESIDYFLAATPFELYYCGDNITYEPSTGVIHLVLYPSCSFLFLYLYDKWQVRGPSLFVYLAVWTVLSVGFEGVCDLTGVFTYTGWSLSYSILTYPVSAVVLIRLFHFVRKYERVPLCAPSK
ncbi:hypothetical protein B5M42_015120 [Paenibacillus athensensis]|uniref:Uncharacterized protein n=1 Tax=Paenibacillus athensensis TaxID=1967502 RepID=A0A4Y8Q8U9_9BACL|nr:hypothetical protein [Paenibacillus athensensis]MCD1260144.1 hypothetical protein [Paenibacillus athensensis]